MSITITKRSPSNWTETGHTCSELWSGTKTAEATTILWSTAETTEASAVSTAEAYIQENIT